MEDNNWIVLVISQVPLVLYTIISGILSFRSQKRKVDADTAAALGNALADASHTLEGAWGEIRKIRLELIAERAAREELEEKLDDEREERKKLQRELRRWTYFASELVEQAKKNNLPEIPFPPDTLPPLTKKNPSE